ncbi:MAG: hypothetical protein WD628_05770 [Thermomicrobiales bacterium]
MDRSTLVMIILVLDSLAAGLVTYGVLRERGSRSITAGCAAMVVGLAVVGAFVIFSIVRIVF